MCMARTYTQFTKYFELHLKNRANQSVNATFINGSAATRLLHMAPLNAILRYDMLKSMMHAIERLEAWLIYPLEFNSIISIFRTFQRISLSTFRHLNIDF